MLFSNFYNGQSNHENITKDALQSILRPDIYSTIEGGHPSHPFVGNVGLDLHDNYPLPLIYTPYYDPAHHFDSSYFQEGAAFINGNYQSILAEATTESALTSNSGGGVPDLFGQILHTAQDFYAHSNWVDGVGSGQIVDSGNGMWNGLVPYSVVNGAVVIEGTANPSPSSPIQSDAGLIVGLSVDANYAAASNPDFHITVHFADGSTLPGLVSGTYEASSNHVPSAVAVRHDDTTTYQAQSDMLGDVYIIPVQTATGLEKDKSDRAGFAQARAVAVDQTEHEFYRLLHLVLDQEGETAVDNLICDWVLPDQQDAVKQAIGLDTSGNTPAGPTTVVSSTPVNVPLGDCVHAGDTILIHATLDTSDPDENGEGEPLILQMSGGTKPDGTHVQGQMITINTYGQERDVTVVAQVDNETLSAYIPDADDDETGTVTGENTANSDTDLNSSQDQDLEDDSSQENIDASLLAAAADADGGVSAAAIAAGSASPAITGPVTITFTTTTSGTVASVAAPATSAQAASAGYEVLAALEWRESTALNAVAIPKPDPADGTVPTPQPHPFSLAAPGADSKEVAAFNAYYASIGQVIGLADALHSALDKAAGAKAAGHAAAEIAQDTAARGFASQLSALLGQQPTLRANLAAALKAAGVTQTVSSSNVQSFESQVASSGLPAAITKVLQLTGADSTTLAAIRTLATVQDPSTVAGTLPDALAGGALATSLPKAAAAVQSLASADLGVAIVPISDALPPGTAPTSVVLGAQIVYNVTVTNASALSVSGAVLKDAFDPSLSDVTWASTASGGAQAPAAGAGNILATLSLPPGASVTFTVTATVSARPAGGTLADTASVALPAGLTDAHPSDNTATSTLQVAANPTLKPLQVVAIAAQEATAGKALSFQSHIVDPNFPAGQVTFSLDPGAPAGAKVDPKTGLFTWTPGAGAATASITIRATDYSDPSLSAARTFSVHVSAVGGIGGVPVVSSAAIVSSLANPTYGQSLFFGAAVAASQGLGTPTGTLQFVVDGSNLGSPVALANGAAISPSLATLGAGVHHVAAVYSGDANYAAIVSPILTTTLARAPLTIVASSATKIYGRANPPIFAAGFGFAPGQSLANLTGVLNFATTANVGSHVGLYPVTPSGLTSANYAITYVNGTMIVTPAPLTIRADDATRAFGQPNPLLTASYSGFVNGDTPASLTTPVVLWATANSFSPVGTYAIAAWGASSHDYAITLVPGALTVTAPPAGASPITQGWTAFATTLYEEVLGRNPDPVGLAFWVQMLNRRVPPLTVALAFWNSPEHSLLLATNRAPRIALATALTDAQTAGRVALGLASTPPRGPLPLAVAAWRG